MERPRTLLFALFRPLLFSLFLLTFISYLRFTRRARRQHFPAITAFTLAYAVTILAHALTLADYDRFATSFDWIPFLVVGLMISDLLTHRVTI